MSEQQAANRKLYISDWHYGHNNILAFDNRPFKTVEDMNAALVERWNAAVHPGDTVYILGDMFWCNMQEAISVLNQLNGQVFLIKGSFSRSSSRSRSIWRLRTPTVRLSSVITQSRVLRTTITAGIICTVMFITLLSGT